MERERGERKSSQRREEIEGRIGHFQFLRESLFSVFVDNIPGDKDVFWLRKLFDSVGKTQDVFIPSKERRATRSRFGFVRFKEMEEATAAISRWNGSMFGRCRLIVKLADSGGKPRISKIVSGKGQQGRGPVLHRRNDHFKEGVVYSVDDSFQCTAKRRKVSLEVIPENVEWLQTSAVAVLKTFIPTNQLEEELKLSGLIFHKIFPLEGKKILLHFSSMDHLEMCLSGNFDSINRRFSSIQKWKEEEPSRLRSVWLSIIGLPFIAWSEANFQKIAEPFGHYLKMENKDFQETGLERARVLVESSRLDRIFEVLEAVVGDKVVEVVLCEECFFNGRETEWKVDEFSEEGEEDLVIDSNSGGLKCIDRQSCTAEKGGGSASEAEGEKSRWESPSVEALAVPSGCKVQGAMESFHKVSESSLGKEGSSGSSRLRSEGIGKDRKSSKLDVSDVSWNSTLKTYLLLNGKGSSKGLGSKEKQGSGLCVSLPLDVNKVSEFSHSVGDVDQISLAEKGVGWASSLKPNSPLKSPRSHINVNEVELGSDEDIISQEEDFLSRFEILEGASKRKVRLVSGRSRDAAEKAKFSFKVVKRKDSKAKDVFKYQRRKKRAVLDRLKKSYCDELEKEKKRILYQRRNKMRDVGTDQIAEKDLVPGQNTSDKEIDAKERDRRRLQREEAEETYHVALKLGVRGNLPEEEMIQIFEDHLQKQYKESCT